MRNHQREKKYKEVLILAPQRDSGSEGSLRIAPRSPLWLGRDHCLMIPRDSAFRLGQPARYKVMRVRQKGGRLAA